MPGAGGREPEGGGDEDGNADERTLRDKGRAKGDDTPASVGQEEGDAGQRGVGHKEQRDEPVSEPLHDVGLLSQRLNRSA